MRILLLGSGAREHALACALAPGHELVAVPGNPGIGQIATNIKADPCDAAGVTALAVEMGADLVVVGPEAPLVAGVADALREAGFPVFGPGAAAARLEGSKAFAKEVMAAAAVPTAEAAVCEDAASLAAALDRFGAPYVVKDDGLAAGKGVVVTEDREVALAHGRACLAKEGGRVVIEDFLDGPEVSLFCLCDGATVRPLAPAQDFKRLRDGNEGPNTGGMGAYSPLTWAPEGLAEQVVAEVAQPVVDEMARRGTPFIGLLYCGLALTSKGLRVVEFNVRFGDPETQAVLARLENSLPELLLAAATGRLHEVEPPRWSTVAAVDVVVAAPGYPAQTRTGGRITGLEEAGQVPGVQVLHAGTGYDDDGALVATGGRVLSVVAVGETVQVARERAYEAVGHISLPGAQYRTDIALGR